MEAADLSFIEGLRLLFVARACRKNGRGTILSIGAESLADGYNRQAMSLMMENIAEAAGETDAASADLPVGCHDQARQSRSQGGGAESEGEWFW